MGKLTSLDYAAIAVSSFLGIVVACALGSLFGSCDLDLKPLPDIVYVDAGCVPASVDDDAGNDAGVTLAGERGGVKP